MNFPVIVQEEKQRNFVIVVSLLVKIKVESRVWESDQVSMEYKIIIRTFVNIDLSFWKKTLLSFDMRPSLGFALLLLTVALTQGQLVVPQFNHVDGLISLLPHLEVKSLIGWNVFFDPSVRYDLGFRPPIWFDSYIHRDSVIESWNNGTCAEWNHQSR